MKYPIVKIKLWMMVAAVAVLAAASGAIEITPVGTDLRFAAASIVLIFALLVFRRLPLIATGLATAIAIFILRVLLDYFYRAPGTELISIAWLQFPGSLYYFLIGLFLQIFNIRRYWDNLVITGILTIGADISANLVELVIRDGIAAVNLRSFVILMTVSTIRIIWITTLVGLIRIRQLQARQQEERLRLDKIMMVISGLYTESFLLKKTLREMEHLMKSCYSIYSRLRSSNSLFDHASTQVGSKNNSDHNVSINNQMNDLASYEELSELALQISHRTHEIKKDLQRTLAGLDKFIWGERFQNIMTFEEIVSIVTRSHANLTQRRGQNIHFSSRIEPALFQTDQIYTLISILNNLVINAIESLPAQGLIEIRIYEKESMICFEVADNGQGVPENKFDLIFDPGYTTKFGADGSPFTGIGLNHVSIMAAKLDGSVEIEQESGLPGGGKGVVFKVSIPASNLKLGDGEK